MIDVLLKYLVGELNDYFYAVSPPPTVADRVRVVAGSLFDLDGKVKDEIKNKVVASVVNIQEDRVYHSADVYERRDDGTSERIRPEVKVNVFVLFVAHHAEYEVATARLSRIIAFFQHRTSFPYAEVPGAEHLDGRFTVDLDSMTFEQQNHLWGALGAKYMPSVMYKLAIVDIRDRQVTGEIPPVLDLETNPSPMGA